MKNGWSGVEPLFARAIEDFGYGINPKWPYSEPSDDDIKATERLGLRFCNYVWCFMQDNKLSGESADVFDSTCWNLSILLIWMEYRLCGENSFVEDDWGHVLEDLAGMDISQFEDDDDSFDTLLEDIRRNAETIMRRLYEDQTNFQDILGVLDDREYTSMTNLIYSYTGESI